MRKLTFIATFLFVFLMVFMTNTAMGQSSFSVSNSANDTLLYVGSTGNVGISTTNPLDALDINGSLGLKGVETLARTDSIVYMRGGGTSDLLPVQTTGLRFVGHWPRKGLDITDLLSSRAALRGGVSIDGHSISSSSLLLAQPDLAQVAAL